ncbi:MAG: hypothetical protein JST89_00475 [Cyanobacteria bacterium SZAS-4]|nr:hypothetical protein [Cyanobacteria bacterium SZAS-4]
MPTTSVLVEDKIAGKPPSEKYRLHLPGERIKVKDLIRLYVVDQVERHNQRPTECSSRHQGGEELILNPSKPTKSTQPRNCDTEYERALSAFSANGFFLFVDGSQVSELEEEVTIKSNTEVSFLRLTPLVGG